MYIQSNKEIDKKVNVSKIANNINTVGDDSLSAAFSMMLLSVPRQTSLAVIASVRQCRAPSTYKLAAG